MLRNIYNINKEQLNLPLEQRKYLLHSVALIGVRSVLGIENPKGSPFNVQRNVHIPNLTFEEVEEMFGWHERESEQTIDQEVIERLYYETKGQPGLTSWFGELLTEGCHLFKAVFHFNLYMYLSSFINGFHGEVYPEFPTGNGKIDLIIKYKKKIYGIELKTYTNAPGYKEALKQAAKYGRQLGLDKISLIFFVETINDESREKYEADFEDEETGVRVEPVFVATGH